jgi:carbohydrate diacid regulator
VPRWAAQAIARSTGLPERNAFVINRDSVVLALLDASGGLHSRVVLERATSTIEQAHGASLRAGIGTRFRGLAGFRTSYQQALHALRCAGRQPSIVFWPTDVRLFDELIASPGAEVEEVIPPATRQVLQDSTSRTTLEAFFAAELSIADAARTLLLHPNSLRYRLRRIAELTGLDPRRPTDAIELITAARVMSRADHDGKDLLPVPTRDFH